MPRGFIKRDRPYKNYKFRVLWDDKPVMGISKVGPLRRVTNVVPRRGGGWNSTD